MGQLLFLDCCVRGKVSRTLALCESLIDELKQTDAALTVTTRRLYEEELPPLDRRTLEERDRLIAAKDWGNPLFDDAREFASADVIVIGAPYWDYSFPACLKNYVERISVNGILFTYVDNGSVGLCRARQLAYISTAGGFIPESGHLGEMYFRQLCDFYGIKECVSYCVQGLDIEGTDISQKMDEAEQAVRSLASI